MPAAFLGHGTPRITFQRNSITEAWREFAAGIPRPRAIVVVSAHWYINAAAVTSMARPRTIHDFYYGPEDLYAFEYPAPGDPALVEQMVELVKPTWLGPDVDSWGFDHGTWALLAHLYPEADIPVVQLAIDATKTFEEHLDLGARLAPLREDGVLVIGSGNIVHNGRATSDAGRASSLYERAASFDIDVRELVTSEPAQAAKLAEHPDFKVAAPTDDHFIPLLYVAGLASASGQSLELLIDGREHDALNMTAYALG